MPSIDRRSLPGHRLPLVADRFTGQTRTVVADDNELAIRTQHAAAKMGVVTQHFGIIQHRLARFPLDAVGGAQHAGLFTVLIHHEMKVVLFGVQHLDTRDARPSVQLGLRPSQTVGGDKRRALATQPACRHATSTSKTRPIQQRAFARCLHVCPRDAVARKGAQTTLATGKKNAAFDGLRGCNK